MMPSPRQGELFPEDEQAELFDQPLPAYRPDLDDVRARLQKMLAEARAAKKLSPQRVSLFQAIFPHMTTWLPDEEGAQLRFEFETEMERLKAA